MAWAPITITITITVPFRSRSRRRSDHVIVVLDLVVAVRGNVDVIDTLIVAALENGNDTVGVFDTVDALQPAGGQRPIVTRVDELSTPELHARGTDYVQRVLRCRRR